MGLELAYEDGQTPLSEEEKEGLLIKTITTHGELDEHEQLNIEKAVEWIIKTKFKKEKKCVDMNTTIAIASVNRIPEKLVFCIIFYEKHKR